MSFFIECCSDVSKAFVADPIDGESGLVVRRLPLDRYRVEFHSESEVLLRQAAPCGKYWCLDPLKKTIVLGWKPNTFRHRPIPGSDHAEFILSSDKDGYIALMQGSIFVAGKGMPVRFSLRFAASMEIVQRFPQPSMVDLFSCQADESYRSGARSCGQQKQSNNGSITPKPILMRRTMPMASASRLDLFTKLARMLRIMPIEAPQRLECSNMSNRDCLRSILQCKFQRSNSSELTVDNIYTVRLNFECEAIQERFIEEKPIETVQTPSWHNVSMMEKIDALVRMEMAEPLLKIPPAVVDIFQQSAQSRLRSQMKRNAYSS